MKRACSLNAKSDENHMRTPSDHKETSYFQMKKILFLTAFSILYHLNISYSQLASPCFPATARVDLDINNVRAGLLNAGDMWWDMVGSAGYEVPKNSGKHSLFAGAIWIGGIDQSGQLRVAAQMYRSRGSDFYPGPLRTSDAGTDNFACGEYDKIWKLNKYEVEEFSLKYNVPGYTIPSEILTWPAHGDVSKGYSYYLAPFFDRNGDGVYNPYDGDYPDYDFDNQKSCENKLLGEQTLYWIFNDKGNAHKNSAGEAIGLEIHAQAFAYRADDEINDATFYKYKLINRGSYTIDSTYFGLWTDADLGLYTDDYVGSDVGRGLGYVYNGVDIDGSGGPNHYGANPPALGIDFLQGPLQDFDGSDNGFGIGANESINGWGYGDAIADNERLGMSRFMYFSGTGITGDPFTATNFYNYMRGIWKDGTQMVYGGTGHVSSSGADPNTPAKFIFPGNSDQQYHFGTNGIIKPEWSEVTVSNPSGDRRFVTSAGPFTMAPGAVNDITIGAIWGRDTTDPSIEAGITAMKIADDKAQLLANSCFQQGCVKPFAEFSYQADLLNHHFAYYGSADTFNWTFGDGATSDKKYPSHTYAQPGNYTICLTVTNACGTQNSCKTISAVKTRDKYGVELTRIEGQGNGGWPLDFTAGSVNNILNSSTHKVSNPVYTYNRGPVSIEVLDPANYTKGDFSIFLTGTDSAARWKLFKWGSTDTITSNEVIGTGGTQFVPQFGFNVTVKQPRNLAAATKNGTGFIEASKIYADSTKKWLGGVKDIDYIPYSNWIRSGLVNDFNNPEYNDYVGRDNKEIFENVLNGTWAPYTLTSYNKHGPAVAIGTNLSRLDSLKSIDLVFTPDKTKWTRCAVIETGDDPALTENGVPKLGLRSRASVNKDGLPDGTGTGMGWFPGYAICLETGERLNIAFGEDSGLPGENGRDMIWNPTSTSYNTAGDVLFGGKHYIYVFNNDRSFSGNTSRMPHYDEGEFIKTTLPSSSTNVWRAAMWVGIPLLESGQQLLSNEVKIKLRVSMPYARYFTSAPAINSDNPWYNFNTNNISIDIAETKTWSKLTYSLFPNPFTDFTMLQFDNQNSGLHVLKVYDLTGKLVMEQVTATGRIKIDRGNLSPGIYLFKLTGKDSENSTTGKFVVQ